MTRPTINDGLRCLIVALGVVCLLWSIWFFFSWKSAEAIIDGIDERGFSIVYTHSVGIGHSFSSNEVSPAFLKSHHVGDRVTLLYDPRLKDAAMMPSRFWTRVFVRGAFGTLLFGSGLFALRSRSPKQADAEALSHERPA